MGQAFNKGSRQGAQMSARAVLARRAVQPPPGDVAVAPAAPLPHYHPSAPVAAVQVEEELMDPALLDVISKVEMVKSRYEKTTADSSHLAVMIRQRKDEELLDLQSKEKSLVVGRGRLSEKDIFEMLESVRLDPEENNPMVLAKRYNLGIHSVILITSSVRSPTVLSDAEGNLYAV